MTIAAFGNFNIGVMSWSGEDAICWLGIAGSIGFLRNASIKVVHQLNPVELTIILVYLWDFLFQLCQIAF